MRHYRTSLWPKWSCSRYLLCLAAWKMKIDDDCILYSSAKFSNFRNFLSTRQFIQNIQEFLIPKLRQKFNLWMCCGDGEKSEEQNSIALANFDDLHIEEMSENDPRIKQVGFLLAFAILRANVSTSIYHRLFIASRFLFTLSLFSCRHIMVKKLNVEYPRECKGSIRDLWWLSGALHSIRICCLVLIDRTVCRFLGAAEQFYRNSIRRL